MKLCKACAQVLDEFLKVEGGAAALAVARIDEAIKEVQAAGSKKAKPEPAAAIEGATA